MINDKISLDVFANYIVDRLAQKNAAGADQIHALAHCLPGTPLYICGEPPDLQWLDLGIGDALFFKSANYSVLVTTTHHGKVIRIPWGHIPMWDLHLKLDDNLKAQIKAVALRRKMERALDNSTDTPTPF